MQSNLYPPSPKGIPSNLTSPKSSFKKQSWIAGGVLFLFMFFYLGLTGWFLYKSVTLLMNLVRGGTDGFLSIVLFLLMGFLGIFMLKGLFFKIRRDESRNVEITKESEPELFAFIHQVAAEVKAPKPHRIFISESVNACVFYDISIINLIFPRRKNLEIGLGLVNVLNLAEFKAVLAHEFGHFAQKSMIIGRWVYVSQQVVHQIVHKRDVFDNFLRAISGIDLRVAWIGWGMSIIVWCLRSLAETFFRLVLFTQRALSRQMEFNADLFAVSVTGSDSLIHSLYKLGIADDAYENAIEFANKQLRKGLLLPDIFSIQSKSIVNTRLLLGNPSYGIAPDLTDKDGSNVVVFDEKLAQIPKMWSTHPSNTDREKNAKNIYVRSIADDRPVWLLFSNAQELRKKFTEALYTNVKKDDTKLLLPEEAEKQFDNEFEKRYFKPQYQGIYQNRFITTRYENAKDIIDPILYSTFYPDDFRKLYPQSLQSDVEQLKNLEEQLFMLEGLNENVLDAGGNKLIFNGKEILKKDIPYAIEETKRELEMIQKKLADHDTACRNIHYMAAKKIGNGWDEYLLSIIQLVHYCEHTIRNIEVKNKYFYEYLDVAVRTKSFSSNYLNPLINAANELHTALNETFKIAPSISINDRISSHLEERSLDKVLTEFDLVRMNHDNINDWIKVIPDWVQFTLDAITQFRSAALEELLYIEEYVEETIQSKTTANQAPSSIVIDNQYTKFDEKKLKKIDKKPDFLSRIYHADGVMPTITRLAVAALIIGFGIFFSMNIGGARIYIYNGLPREVIVHVDDKEIFIDPESTKNIKLSHKDKVHIKTTTETGVVIEEFDGSMSGTGSHIYNIASGAVLYKWYAYYGSSSYLGNKEPEIIGNERWFTSNADYIFDEPPESMSLKAGQTSTKDVLAVHIAPPYQLVNLLTDPTQISNLIVAHAKWDKTNSPNILLWIDMVYSFPNFKEILSHRLEIDPNDVLVMRLQQDIFTGKEKEELCNKQDKLYANDPNNANLYYLKWRCIEDSYEQDSAFMAGYKKWPNNGWLANAVAYNNTLVENWEEALKCYSTAIEKTPELTPMVAVEIKRINQFLNKEASMAKENENVPQLAYLNAIEKSTDNSTEDKLYAYQLLSDGKLKQAILYCESDSNIYPFIVRLAAVSDGASQEIQKIALNFPLQYGIDNTTLIPALALRQKNRLSIDVYKDQINGLAPDNTDKFYAFIKAVNTNKINEADKILKNFGTELKAKSCLYGVIILGIEAPLKWQMYASKLLFVTERPYSKAQFWKGDL